MPTTAHPQHPAPCTLCTVVRCRLYSRHLPPIRRTAYLTPATARAYGARAAVAGRPGRVVAVYALPYRPHVTESLPMALEILGGKDPAIYLARTAGLCAPRPRAAGRGMGYSAQHATPRQRWLGAYSRARALLSGW